MAYVKCAQTERQRPRGGDMVECFLFFVRIRVKNQILFCTCSTSCLVLVPPMLATQMGDSIL